MPSLLRGRLPTNKVPVPMPTLPSPRRRRAVSQDLLGPSQHLQYGRAWLSKPLPSQEPPRVGTGAPSTAAQASSAPRAWAATAPAGAESRAGAAAGAAHWPQPPASANIPLLPPGGQEAPGTVTSASHCGRRQRRGGARRAQRPSPRASIVTATEPLHCSLSEATGLRAGARGLLAQEAPL